MAKRDKTQKNKYGQVVTTLIGGQQIINVHTPDKCHGEFCTIHNNSDHHMRDWPQNWRPDRGIMERLCKCGVGHPDPDDPIFKKFPYEGIHGCDLCCSKDQEYVVDSTKEKD